jgi:transcriptional regulator with XRE-family HTH domain
MRPSPLRHNLARLRQRLNLGQKKMADVARCSTPTIQSIELGRLALSESLARRISAATGVGLRWLLDNDLSAPIVNRAGYPYLRLTFESRQAGKAFGDNRLSRQSLADFAAAFYGQIRAILSSASKRNFAEVATWRLGKFLDTCRREFGHDEGLIEMDESPYPNTRQVEAAIEVFRRYDRERTARRPTIHKFSKEDNARFVAHMQSMLDKKPAAKEQTIKRSRATPHRKRRA